MDKRKLKLDKYGISGKRFKELSGFCEQYPEWKKQLNHMTDAVKSPVIDGIGAFSGNTSDSTGNLAIKRLELGKKCDLIENTARQANEDLAKYIIQSVCYELPLRYLLCVEDMPCSRAAFYDTRRYFFYLLDQNKRT
jgi:hypothetical protein